MQEGNRDKTITKPGSIITVFKTDDNLERNLLQINFFMIFLLVFI